MSHWTQTKWGIWKFYASNDAKKEHWGNLLEKKKTKTKTLVDKGDKSYLILQLNE